MASIDSGTKSYDQFIKEMNAAGIKTTHINTGKEANFADYGNALSDEIKSMIVDSYDNARDYELQAQIAGIYADSGKSVLQSKDFINACKSLGFEVNVTYKKTSYISDYKNGNFDNSVGNGSIAIYTISDGMGGEIVVADANGNAALESEELFMNQILGDINYDISATKGVGASFASKGSGSSNGVSGAENTNNLFANEKDKEVKQADYNSAVEKFLENGASLEDAMRRADTQLGVDTMTYTGSMEEKSKVDVESTAKEAAAKQTDNEDVLEETVAQTVDETDETEDEVVVADFASEAAEEMLKEMELFATV